MKPESANSHYRLFETTVVLGLFWCVTIIGIPIGRQCFEIASFALFPFGKKILYKGKVASWIYIILWLIPFGIFLALLSFIGGIFMCISILGIPLGIQLFKLTFITLIPFGVQIVKG